MKKVLLILTLFISSFSLSAQVKFENGNLRTLIEKASSDNKLIFLDCYAVWCGPCKYMDTDVFSRKDVGD
ncbi:MAG: thioredoxin domain-containing protein, partial [Rikenellaceae bacterium]